MTRKLQLRIDNVFHSKLAQFHNNAHAQRTKRRRYRLRETREKQKTNLQLMSICTVRDIRKTQLHDAAYVHSLFTVEGLSDQVESLICTETLPDVSRSWEDERERGDEQKEQGGQPPCREISVDTSTKHGKEHEEEKGRLYVDTCHYPSTGGGGEGVGTQETGGLQRVYVFIVRKDSVERMGYRRGFSCPN
jgi:hypothetical protein